MKPVLKYNILKCISLLLTVGTPSVTMIVLNTVMADSPAGAISIVTILSLLFSCIFLKDKIAENLKMPSPLVLVIILLGIIFLLESILLLAKYTCVITAIMCGVDELTFKNWYKRLEKGFAKDYPNVNVNDSKKFGFIISTSKKLFGVE